MRRRYACVDHRSRSTPSDLFEGDARDGIWLDTKDGKRKTYLFVWIDDYSRNTSSGRYYFDEKLPRMEDTFERLVLRWGIPLKVYLDNGSVYIAKQFAWILGQLKTAKLHHKPYQAYCKGKGQAATRPSTTSRAKPSAPASRPSKSSTPLSPPGSTSSTTSASIPRYPRGSGQAFRQRVA